MNWVTFLFDVFILRLFYINCFNSKDYKMKMYSREKCKKHFVVRDHLVVVIIWLTISDLLTNELMVSKNHFNVAFVTNFLDQVIKCSWNGGKCWLQNKISWVNVNRSFKFNFIELRVYFTWYIEKRRNWKAEFHTVFHRRMIWIIIIYQRT